MCYNDQDLLGCPQRSWEKGFRCAQHPCEYVGEGGEDEEDEEEDAAMGVEVGRATRVELF